MQNVRTLVGRLVKESRNRFKTVFIAGTDTDVGKTHVTTRLINLCEEIQSPVFGFKPISCGSRDDAVKYWTASKKAVPLDIINPIYLKIPVAPFAQSCPSFGKVSSYVKKSLLEFKRTYKARLVLIEGAGGIHCPITARKTMLDLVQEFDWSVILVAPNKLGVLNHVLLNLEVLNARGIDVCGVILNEIPGSNRIDVSRRTNARILKDLIRVPLYCF